MNCNEIRDNLSLYIDDELNEDEKRLMDEHFKSCFECSKELEEYKKIIEMLNELPDEEPPLGYCKRLHDKLLYSMPEIPENNQETEISKVTDMPVKHKNSKFRWVKYGSLAAALALVVLVYGINNNGLRMGKSNNEMSYDYSTPSEAPTAEEAPMEPSAPMPTDAFGGNMEDYKDKDVGDIRTRNEESIGQISLMAAEEREMKIIKAGSIYAQTEDYDRFLDEITQKIYSYGGYIEYNNTEVYQVYEDEKLMHGSLKIRVPQKNFNDTVSYLEQTTEIRRKNINETDVTKEYYEKDNKAKNLEVQEQHLRDLFEKATTVEEMLQIENELRRIRTEIDALNISLADINDRAAMSTISLEVEEVKEVNFTLKSEENVWERAKEGFINTVNSIVRGIENLIVNLVSSSPVLIPVIIIFVILLSKIKKYWKRKL